MCLPCLNFSSWSSIELHLPIVSYAESLSLMLNVVVAGVSGLNAIGLLVSSESVE